MRTISEIYKEYKILPTLQEHMLRVAAVASLICDNFTEELPASDIIAACLMHDMGNLIKSKMDVLPDFFEPEGVAFWQKIKDEFIEKYGADEHEATIQIMREAGLAESAILLADANRFSWICRHRDAHDMGIKIMHYADGRVDPHGIVSYEARMNEAQRRYPSKDVGGEEERQRLIDCGKDIEQQIFAKCTIKPEEITDKTAAPIIEKLRDFVIK